MSVRVIEGFTRDLGLPEIPKEWEIYNAARPFPAHKTWQGEFLHGIFYGAIDPDEEYADEYRKRAKELDASRLTFISRESVERWGQSYCEKHSISYDDFDFKTIARSYLQHHRDK